MRAFGLAPLRRTLDRAARPLSASSTTDAAAPTAPTAADADAGAPFAELQGMHPAVTKALHALGFAAGTGIQSRAIPAVARGSDVVIAAETGSGKTLAYLAPVFSNLLTNASAAGAYTRPLFSST